MNRKTGHAGRIADISYIDKNAENSVEVRIDRWPEREKSVSGYGPLGIAYCKAYVTGFK
jgi:hypothetical protein